MKEPYTLLILAGGQSRRMGEDKAKLKIGGVTFTERIAGAFPDAAEVLVSFSGEAGEVPAGAKTVTDRYPGAGPLAGIQSGLAAAANDLIFVTACDMPLMDEAFAKKLLAAMPEEGLAVVSREEGGRVHPLAGWYRRGAEPAARRLLEQGERRMMRFLEAIGSAVVPAAPEEAGKLRNVNDPGEYRALLELLQGAGEDPAGEI